MTTQTILTAIAAVFPVTVADITGPRRRRSESDARHLAAYLLYSHLRMSNSQLGDMLCRCPSGMTHSRQRFSDLYATDRQYRAMVDRVLAQLGVQMAA